MLGNKSKESFDLFSKKIKEHKTVHENMLKKDLNNLNNTIKSEKYNIDTMISNTGLGSVYHDLIDSKDKINSKYQRKYNQGYHQLDVELYKLNKRIDNETKLITYKFNNKKDKVVNQVLTRMF